MLHRIKGFHLYASGQLRKLYDWVISWGHTPYGTWALITLAFIESSFFPIPPDVLLICLCISNTNKSYWYALLTTISSVVGGWLGYLIGYAFYETIGKLIITALTLQNAFENVGILFQNNAFWAIFAAGLTPIPYKVFTIAAGVWQIDLLTFTTASVFGRAGRFFLVATLLYFFGKKLSTFIDKYFNLLTLAAFALVVLGFATIKIFM